MPVTMRVHTFVLTLTIVVATGGCIGCARASNRAAPSATTAPAPAPNAAGGDLAGRYDISFTIQGSPVDMRLTVRRDSTGALVGSAKAMGTNVPATRITRTPRGMHVDLDPSVSGPASIDLVVQGAEVSGTLSWQGQSSAVTGKRAP